MKARKATLKRQTKETSIAVHLNLDGQGDGNVSTGVPFLDHMLDSLAKHARFDLSITAKGDLEIDVHHTNEDVGIALGQALTKALGSKQGIRRFGDAAVPMEDALSMVALDICGRPLLKVTFPQPRAATLRKASGGNYTSRDAEHFLESLVRHSGLCLHVRIVAGDDFHHMWESVFKGVARALREAVSPDKQLRGIPSTKGTL